MRFGFGTVLWGRRIDDLDYCLDVIAACGYQGVEFAQHFKHIYIREGDRGEKIRRLKDINELLTKLRSRSLELIGLVGGTLDERRVFLKDYRDCYLYVDRWPKKGIDPDFHRQVQECLDAKITLALHPHWLTPICRAEDALKAICEMNSPYIRLLMDTAHAVIAEDDPVEIVQKHHGILGGVHIKNWKPDFGRWSHRYAHGFCLPGDPIGIVKVEQVMSELFLQGYEGWVVLEQDHYIHSREDTAFAGARWMESYGRRWGLHISPNSIAFGGKFAEKRGNPFLARVSNEKLTSYNRRLERLVDSQPDGLVFYREVAKGLRTLLGVNAVKVWSYNSLSEELSLVGCDGLRSKEETSLKLLNSNDYKIVAGTLQHHEVRDYDLNDPAVVEMFKDTTWLNRLQEMNVRWMTVLPLFNTSNPHQLRYISTIFSQTRLITNPSAYLVPQESEMVPSYDLAPDISTLAACVGLDEFGAVIAHWSDYLTDELCTSVAGGTNPLCGEFKGDTVSEFADDLMDHIKKRLSCNCVTIFLEDVTGKHLKPAGRSNLHLEWKGQNNEGFPLDKYYEMSDAGRYTWRAWKERMMIFSSNAAPGKAKEKRPPHDANRDEILFAPLTRRNGKCLGVVRLHNKILPHRYNDWVASMFTDDDAAQLDAIIQAAMPYLELLRHREDEKDGIARMVHEFQTPLVAIRAAASSMRNALRNEGHDPEHFFKQDFLGMVTNWADSMGHLARNAQFFSAGAASLPPQKRLTDLLKDIILPVLHQIRPILGRRKRLEFEYHGFGSLPPLWVDPWQFQSVFFNLVSNACKYGAGTDTVKVDLRAGWHGRFFNISVSDMGQGISEEIREKIFEPKFRAREALASDATGQGLGLYVVRSILTAHESSIHVASTHQPTTFEITLPQTLRYAPTRKHA